MTAFPKLHNILSILLRTNHTVTAWGIVFCILFRNFSHKGYVATYDINPWLDTLQGLNATDKQLYSILNAFIKYANRIVKEVPLQLAWLERYFGITMPLVEGGSDKRLLESEVRYSLTLYIFR